MEIAITGASGLIGKRLATLLESAGHVAIPVVRDSVGDGERTISWDPALGRIDCAAFEGVGAVVHLAGENIAGGRWNAARKRKIYESRVRGTELLSGCLATLTEPPAVLVCASAVGFYGNRGDQPLNEHSPAGNGFLADVCKAWERACGPAIDAGIRVVNARIGVVLSSKGGALAQMSTPFRMGVGGVLGSGRQFMSWITLDDVARALAFCIETSELRGAVNLVSPSPTTNRDFTKTMGRVLHRPTFLSVPELGVRALLGEMGTELLLASTRVEPRRLLDSGFRFEHPDLEEALSAELSQ